MDKHPIIDAAKREMSSARGCLLVVLGLVLLIFGLHHKYIYNALTGPYDLKQVDLEKPGMIRSIKSEGQFVKIGSQKTKRLKLESGGYFLHKVGDKNVLVAMGSDFEGSAIEGRLKKMSKKEKEAFGELPDLATYMVKAGGGYVWNTSVFMYGAMLAFPLILFSLLSSLLKGNDPLKHQQIAGLKALGEPRSLVTEIESEIAAQNTGGEMLMHSSPKWFVLFHGKLIILPQDQLKSYKFTDNDKLVFEVADKSDLIEVLIEEDKLPLLVQQFDIAIPEKAGANS